MAKRLSRETIRNLGVIKTDFPAFKVGDTVAVSQRIKEKDKDGKVKERIQVFEGDVIAMHKKGASSTFTIRKISANSIAVERMFPYNSPLVESIAFVRHGDVRRAKLFYMRDRVGKAARVKERVITAEQRKQQAQAGERKQEVAAEEANND